MVRALAIAVLTPSVAQAISTHSDAGTQSKLQAWSSVLDGTDSRAASRDTPVTRVVKLLKGMQGTLKQEMDEDEAQYGKLKCWCNDNKYAKGNAASESESKISQLQSDVESLTAKSSELKGTIAELETEVAADKKSLAEATALREKQLKEAQGMELDSRQNIENLKAAITVLSKHHAAPVESTVEGGAVFKSERDSWSSFLSAEAKASLRTLGLAEPEVTSSKFLQQGTSWSAADTATVARGLKSASSFVQARGGEEYYPSYQSQSGGIMGVLKQLKEEMEGTLSDAQKLEASRAADFAELRSAKTSEIDNGEKMSERKEDEKADTDNKLAEAKEDLEQEQAALAESQKFLNNLKTTCADADKNFEERKAARLAEIQAVSETIGILQADEARDVMSSTYSLVQVKVDRGEQVRRDAAETLRRIARKVHDPRLSVFATSVELDSFTKVKKAIDDMIAMMKTQQADEVKKNDWCKTELHSNDMTTATTSDEKAALETKIADLENDIKTFEGEISNGQDQIAQLQLDLQRASEDRIKENHDFQKTVADQTAVIEVLKKALDKLANFYDLAQVREGTQQAVRQTPPVPQMEYSKNSGASGVMQMIEKLISEAKGLVADSKKSESEAQSAYETLVADTNDSVKDLQEQVVSKTKAKSVAKKDKQQADSDLIATVKELEGLAKYNAELHGACNYLLKNFDLRQKARQEEIEAMQQAKQILSGASA
eukprot:TRINITY_DN40948_c0_g1_i1.p1 TRINITY_DN40948_c0_g1~~TRINITY_DN40948_c0_g1_i1.p1  ORF type:complete len:719 (+),score=195.63 TRINITY_DN40948_c0_g1_i1:54-2210(+)